MFPSASFWGLSGADPFSTRYTACPKARREDAATPPASLRREDTEDLDTSSAAGDTPMAFGGDDEGDDVRLGRPRGACG